MVSVVPHSAASAMKAAQADLTNHANNIANMHTTGYKRIMTETIEQMPYVAKAGGADNVDNVPRPSTLTIGGGVKDVTTYTDMSQGAIKQTGGELDIAILASGYFAIALPNGRVGYTRSGHFKKSAEGEIVTHDGRSLENPIFIPEELANSAIEIKGNGQIVAQDPDNLRNEIEIGQLELFTFNNPQGLKKIEAGLHEETLSSGESIQLDTDGYLFQQGALEESNVDSTEELQALMQAGTHMRLCMLFWKEAGEIEKFAIETSK